VKGNGQGHERRSPKILRQRSHDPTPLKPLTLSFLVGTGAIVAGFITIAIGWYHIGNTDQVWIQNQELMSGGIGGLGLIIVGVGLLIRDRLAPSQTAASDATPADTEKESVPDGGDADVTVDLPSAGAAREVAPKNGATRRRSRVRAKP
jgi:hypothetical protein